MPAIPLGLQSYDRARGQQPETRLVNMYLEEDQSDASPDQTYRLQRPGLTRLVTFPGAIRGIYQSDNVISSLTVVVAGGQLFTTDGAGIDLVGSLPDDGQQVRIAASFERVGICTAGQFFVYDGDTLAQIEMPDNQFIVDIEVINSYFILALSDGTFFWLAPGSTTVDPLDFATAEALPDGIVSVRRLRDNLFFFGSRSVEVWQTTGDPDSLFVPAGGRMSDRGCMARETAHIFDNTLIFLGDDGLIYRVSDVPQRVSTFGIEEKIRNRTDDCSAFTFTTEGHKFYVLRVPGVGTFAFDVATQVWCEFATLNATVFAPHVGMDSNAGAICADSTGKLYRLDPDATTDDGLAIKRLVTGTVGLASRPQRNSSIAIGVGSADAATYSLRYRDARDFEWSPAITLSARSGADVLNAWRLGIVRGTNRTFEISTVSPTIIRISGALANESWAV